MKYRLKNDLSMEWQPGGPQTIVYRITAKAGTRVTEFGQAFVLPPHLAKLDDPAMKSLFDWETTYRYIWLDVNFVEPCE